MTSINLECNFDPYVHSKSLSYFKNKKILITGANGFIASHLIDFFISYNETFNEKIQLLCIVRDYTKIKSKYKNSSNKNIRFIEADCSKAFSIPERPDIIIHAASQASPKYYKEDPVGTIGPNIFGTQFLLDFSYKNRIEQFIFISSGEVYGQLPEHFIPTREDFYGYVDPIEVRSCYAESKRMGENLCISWSKQFGVNVKIVRPFHTYGPGIRLDDGRVYADFIASIIQGKDLIIKSNGLAKRAYCYISDFIRGLLTVLVHGENGHAYNIGNDKSEVSVKELAETLIKLFPEKNLSISYANREKGDTYLTSPISRNCPDITKIKTLGWEPTVGIEEGFKKTILSYDFFNKEQ